MNEFSQTILYLIARKGENQQIKAFNAASSFCAVKLKHSEIPRHPLLLLTHSQQLAAACSSICFPLTMLRDTLVTGKEPQGWQSSSSRSHLTNSECLIRGGHQGYSSTHTATKQYSESEMMQ